MKKRWISAGLAVWLLMAAFTGSAVMASDGDTVDPEESEAREEVIVKDTDISTVSFVNDEVDAAEEPDELAVRVAEILGTDPQATYDAMVRADAAVDPNPGRSGEGGEAKRDADSMSVEAKGSSYLDYGNRIGAILGVDGLRVAQAIAQAYEELYAVERDIYYNESGRDTEGKYESDKHPAEPDAG